MLNQDQYLLLKMGYKSRVSLSDASCKLNLSEDRVIELLNALPDGFIVPDNSDRTFTDAIKGESAFEEYNRIMIKDRNGWIRYCITTAIAIAALLKSFAPELASLWKQLMQ